MYKLTFGIIVVLLLVYFLKQLWDLRKYREANKELEDVKLDNQVKRIRKQAEELKNTEENKEK